MAIIGIAFDEGVHKGKEMDYCREEIFDAEDLNHAWAKAETEVDFAPKPDNGKLFVRTVEVWKQ